MKKLSIPGKAKKWHVGALAALLCLALLVLLVGTAIGRYQHQIKSEGSVRAKEFYFTSDFLNGGTHTLAPGSTEVSFTLSSHADELRFSEMDITYEVTVSPSEGVDIQYSKADKKFTGVDINAEDVSIADYTHTVTIKDLKPGTYTVTATGKGGYVKTLNATVKVLGPESAVYKHLDKNNPDYVLLTVWAQGWKGNVTITPKAGTPAATLIPDNTDLVMENAKTGEVFTDQTSFCNDSYSSHTYRFFYGGGGTAGSAVTVDNFDVTCTADGGSTTATEKAPS